MFAARLAMQTCRNILPIAVQYKNLSPLGGLYRIHTLHGSESPKFGGGLA